MFPQAVKILKNKAGATKVARLVIVKIKTRYHASNVAVEEIRDIKAS